MKNKPIFIGMFLITLFIFFISTGIWIESWSLSVGDYLFIFAFILMASSITYSMWYYYYLPKHKWGLYFTSFVIFAASFFVAHWDYSVIFVISLCLTILYTSQWMLYQIRNYNKTLGGYKNV